MKKVTMNLTDQDVKTTERLSKKLNLRSNASTVSSALSVTDLIVDIISKGGDLMVRNSDGSMDRLIIPGLKHE